LKGTPREPEGNCQRDPKGTREPLDATEAHEIQREHLEGSVGAYDEALICQNGHVINSSAKKRPEHNTKFCKECGSQAVGQCSHCSTPIRGDYHTNTSRASMPKVIGFCHECGKPYPWTEARIQAAQQLVEMTAMSDSEKESLKNSAPALLSNVPQTPIVAAKWKQFFQGAGKQVADVGRQILVDVVSETVKKSIWGP